MGTPKHDSYDVVIVGGAMIGSSVAWWLGRDADFDGRVLVIERDPTYECASTSHTNSCIRQQFSTAINIRMSQFAADFLRNFGDWMGEPEPARLKLQSFGYLYLAGSEAGAAALKAAQAVQAANGAATRHMTPDQIADAYPFYHLDDIVAANHNTVDEGYFDGASMFDAFRRKARAFGVEYVTDEVVSMIRNGDRIESVTLASGRVIGCGTLVNATGPRAARTAAMAGIRLPVEPRKRFTFLFSARTPLPCDLPLTIDPSGVHVRTDGVHYMAGCAPDDDSAVAFDDFQMDHEIWEDRVWPTLAHRIPAFEAIRLHQSWAGHYAMNTLDRNAVIGPHTEIGNFIFANGFSGHGLQQAPAVGRGVAEWIVHGAYRTLDLAPFGYARIADNEPIIEQAVI
ncbi:NAD(P)/FAD-dependent oxidoreductase [Oceaniglobus indicus]|uniref:NAD(P)/FAD-dependent oxidoreductase n=1 Tax=Oceaniglobus indicus TaxID=2047749 RepID=UPI000C1A097A|nr:FAD-binding oxidoreductase [Oceaniglobus indicus]